MSKKTEIKKIVGCVAVSSIVFVPTFAVASSEKTVTQSSVFNYQEEAPLLVQDFSKKSVSGTEVDSSFVRNIEGGIKEQTTQDQDKENKKLEKERIQLEKQMKIKAAAEAKAADDAKRKAEAQAKAEAKAQAKAEREAQRKAAYEKRQKDYQLALEARAKAKAEAKAEREAQFKAEQEKYEAERVEAEKVRLAEKEAKAKAKAEREAQRKAAYEKRKKDYQLALEARAKAKAEAKAEREAQFKAEQEKYEAERIEAEKVRLAEKEAKAKAKAEREAQRKAAYEKRQKDYQLALEARAKAKAAAKAEREAQFKAEQEKYEAERIEAEKVRLAEKEAKAKAKAEREAQFKAEQEKYEAELVEAEKVRLAKREAKERAKAERKAQRKAARQKERELAQNKKIESANSAMINVDSPSISNSEAVVVVDTDSPNLKITRTLRSSQLQPPKVVQDVKPNSSQSKAVAADSLENTVKPKVVQEQAKQLVKKNTAIEPLESVSKITSVKPMSESRDVHSIGQPSNLVILPHSSNLQKATDMIGKEFSTGTEMRKEVLGYSASVDERKAFNDRYQYNVSRISKLPPEIGRITLNPVITLSGDHISMFRTKSEKEKVDEFMAYHSAHAKIFSNYVKRVMSLNKGQTNGITLDAMMVEEMAYDLASLKVPSTTTKEASEKYIYIMSRLNEADQAKFWLWVNAIKIDSKIDVPYWVKLVDVMYSH
ncbi:hypothetical protein A7M79_00925 [Acinetobacter baumannii]|uniref:hypothetical protein n=1 Tax=Acinetobacter baumannii TaxID=470 RepID=UPI0008DE476A|nr:hypothetical protein [Acinetobacter baumannii]OIH12081.1 hypothetical protein A7M79_00925 [Acinetobacter baumannii]